MFCGDILFNLVSVVDWRVINSGKYQQVYIDNVQENDRRVTYDYVINNLVYVEMTGIYRKPDYSKQGLYKIKEVFTNGKVLFQRKKVNKGINIRRLTPHFVE